MYLGKLQCSNPDQAAYRDLFELKTIWYQSFSPVSCWCSHQVCIAEPLYKIGLSKWVGIIKKVDQEQQFQPTIGANANLITQPATAGVYYEFQVVNLPLLL